MFSTGASPRPTLTPILMEQNFNETLSRYEQSLSKISLNEYFEANDLLDIIGTTATTDKYVLMAGEFVSNVAKREPSSLLAEENTQELPFDLLALYDNLI